MKREKLQDVILVREISKSKLLLGSLPSDWEARQTPSEARANSFQAIGMKERSSLELSSNANARLMAVSRVIGNRIRLIACPDINAIYYSRNTHNLQHVKI